MKQLNKFRRGIIGALFLLGAATPFALTSCDNEHEAVNITLKSDYSGLAEAMKDNNKSLLEKLGMIEEAIKNGNVNDKDAQELLIQAIKNINGTLDQKLAAIEEAIKGQTTSFGSKLGLIEAAINGGFANDKAALDLIKEALNTLNGTASEKLGAIDEALKSQTTSLETKLGLIQAAIETGLADQKTALGELKTAIESLKGSLDNIDGSIDDIVTALNGLNDTLGTDIAALLQDIKDSIAGLQDYSEILAAIKTAIENIGKDVYDAGEPAEAVDLDLPSGLKWASYNLGASAPEEYGDYFAWGETKPYYTKGHAQDNPCTDWREGKDAGYDWASYFDTKDGGSTFETYTTDKETTLRPEHDAATANWGGSWRMPKISDMIELLDNCNLERTVIGSVNGYKVSSKSNSSKFIFLPIAGYREGNSINFAYDSSYWTSSLYKNSAKAYSCTFDPKGSFYSDSRIIGNFIRPVCP